MKNTTASALKIAIDLADQLIKHRRENPREQINLPPDSYFDDCDDYCDDKEYALEMAIWNRDR